MPRKSKKNDEPEEAKELKIYSGPKNNLPKGTRRATEKEALKAKQIKWYGINEVSNETKNIINSTGTIYKPSDLSKAHGKLGAKIIKIKTLDKDIDNELKLNKDEDIQDILKEYKVLLKGYREILMNEYKKVVDEMKNKLINDDEDPNDGELKEGEYITSLPLNESFYNNIDLIRKYLTENNYKKIKHKRTLEQIKKEKEEKLAKIKKEKEEKLEELKRIREENKIKKQEEMKIKKLEREKLKLEKQKLKEEKIAAKKLNQSTQLNKYNASDEVYNDMKKKLEKDNKKNIYKASDKVYKVMQKKLHEANEQKKFDVSDEVYQKMSKQLKEGNKIRKKEIAKEVDKLIDTKKVINKLIPEAALKRNLKKIENDIIKEERKKKMKDVNMLIPIAAAGRKARVKKLNAIELDQTFKKLNTNLSIPIAAKGMKNKIKEKEKRLNRTQFDQVIKKNKLNDEIKKKREQVLKEEQKLKMENAKILMSIKQAAKKAKQNEIKKNNAIELDQALKKLNTNLSIPIAAKGMKRKIKETEKRLNTIHFDQAIKKNKVNDEIKKKKKFR